MIAIIDSCGANLSSVQFALERLGVPTILTSDAAIIRNADKVILPGVGTAQNAMSKLAELGLIEVIQQLDQPLLGICLGMQLLYQFSEEGAVSGLGILAGAIKPFEEKTLTVPHMGWNKLLINPESEYSPLMNNIENESYVYFVHSYFAGISPQTAAVSHYGDYFSAAVHYKNFFGVQFHPERSGKVGEQILRNFIELE